MLTFKIGKTACPFKLDIQIKKRSGFQEITFLVDLR